MNTAIPAAGESASRMERSFETNGGSVSPPGRDTGRALEADAWIYRIVVTVLGLVMLSEIGGSIALAMADKKAAPEILLALGSAAVGALAGLLAPSPASKR